MPTLEGRLVPSADYESDRAVGMGFELTNTGDQDLYVLTWYTPLEGLHSDCLSVLRDGERLIYDGVLARRGPPTPEDYVLVPARGTVSKSFELSSAYEVSPPGDYDVVLDTDVDLLHHTSSFESFGAEGRVREPAGEQQPLREGGARFTVARGGGRRRPTRGQAARRSGRRRRQRRPEVTRSLESFGRAAPLAAGADPQQEAIISRAHAGGYDLCVAALATLANDGRYREWFGGHTAQRFQKVRDNFTLIRERMDSTTYTYFVGGGECKPEFRAYTYKGEDRIWLCEPFWGLPAGGPDSQAAVVLHEHSHTAAGTDDLRYTRPSCRVYAATEPDRAVRNAANYEYFAS